MKDIGLAVMLPRLTWETPRPMLPWCKPRGKSPYSDIACCETQPTLFLNTFWTLAFEDEYENAHLHFQNVENAKAGRQDIQGQHKSHHEVQTSLDAK